MRNKKIFVALTLVATMAIGSVMVVTADEPAPGPLTTISQTGNVVEFLEPEPPVGPPVNPDPEIDPELPPVRGFFTLTHAPLFDFDSHQIGTNTVFDVLPSTLGANTDHWVGVRDFRNFTANRSDGWRVTANMTTEFREGTVTGGNLAITSDGHVLTGAQIQFASPVGVTGLGLDGNAVPAGPLRAQGAQFGPAAGDRGVLSFAGPAVMIGFANAGQGEGNTALNLGGGTDGTDIQLVVPDASELRVGRFFATVDWVLSAGPGADAGAPIE